MNQELLVGVLALGVPLFAVGYLMLRRNRGVLRMYVAMLLIGLGYLTATGALTDIGRTLMGEEGEVVSATVPVQPAPEAPVPGAPPAAEPEAAVPPADETPPASTETAPAPAPAP